MRTTGGPQRRRERRSTRNGRRSQWGSNYWHLSYQGPREIKRHQSCQIVWTLENPPRFHATYLDHSKLLA